MKFDLDLLRSDLIAWAQSLWLEEIGAFRNGDAPTPSLRSSLFMAYILYSMDALDAVQCDRSRWIAWIQAQQSEHNGSFAFPPEHRSEQPRRGIALWNAVRALNILDGQIVRYPSYQQKATTVPGLRKWFGAWKAAGDAHHEVLALAPTLACHPDPDWVQAFFDELADQQHPTRGRWPREGDRVNISRTFAYSLIHIGMGRIPPQPERIIDTMLDLQEDNGFWHRPTGYSTMDAIYLLSRLPRAVYWREADADTALHRVTDGLIPYYREDGEGRKAETHGFAALVQSFALLSEALPHRFTTSRPWRFSWEKREIWRCQVIAEELAELQAT